MTSPLTPARKAKDSETRMTQERLDEIERERVFWNSVGLPMGWKLLAHDYCDAADFKDANGMRFEITGAVRNQIAELQSIAQGERLRPATGKRGIK